MGGLAYGEQAVGPVALGMVDWTNPYRSRIRPDIGGKMRKFLMVIAAAGGLIGIITNHRMEGQLWFIFAVLVAIWDAVDKDE